MPFETKRDGPFESVEEIREYVAGERIQCLVCGKYFRRLLHVHLAMHNMTHDDYRETFGIPWRTSLTSAPSREASSRLMTPERIEEFKKTLAGRRHPGSFPQRTDVPAVRNLWKRNAELGRYFSRKLVSAPCATCGEPVKTTALTAVQPIHCEKCATPQQMRARIKNRKEHPPKQAA